MTWHSAESESTSSSSSTEYGITSREEKDAMDLIGALNEEIAWLLERKKELDRQMESNWELAIARHVNGSCNAASLLCLRKMSHMKTMKAYTAAARFQLIAIRQQVQTTLEEPASTTSVDLARFKESMEEALNKLEYVPCQIPSDECLLRQLAQHTR